MNICDLYRHTACKKNKKMSEYANIVDARQKRYFEARWCRRHLQPEANEAMLTSQTLTSWSLAA